MYDPRREERRKRSRVELPDDVTPDQLDREVRADLRGLSRETADLVARHLVMTGRLLDDDPERALTHARAASALGGRVGAVREAAGLAAYAAGEWQEALSELRTYRRISGDASHLPVLADCERALGRPERALAVGDDPSVAALDQTVRVELALVLAGARRDLGQQDAAVLMLQGPARATTARHPWAARLWYGYADALLDAGRAGEAEQWFSKVLEVDSGQTDADERLLELQGLSFGDEPSDEPDAGSDPGTDPAMTEDHDGAPERPLALSAAELTALVADVAPLAAQPAAPVAAPAPADEPVPAVAPAGAAAERAAAQAPASPFSPPPAEQPAAGEPSRPVGRPVPAVTFVPAEDPQG